MPVGKLPNEILVSKGARTCAQTLSGAETEYTSTTILLSVSGGLTATRSWSHGVGRLPVRCSVNCNGELSNVSSSVESRNTVPCIILVSDG